MTGEPHAAAERDVPQRGGVDRTTITRANQTAAVPLGRAFEVGSCYPLILLATAMFWRVGPFLMPSPEYHRSRLPVDRDSFTICSMLVLLVLDMAYVEGFRAML